MGDNAANDESFAERMRAFGLSTRKSSWSKAWRPGMWHSTSFEKTLSKVESGNGNCFDASQISKRTRSDRFCAAASWFALWMPGAFTSMPSMRRVSHILSLFD
jgi:hypothetical protein